MAKGYAKSADGLVHLVSKSNADYTLCGDAFEGYGEDFEGFDKGNPSAWVPVKSGPVTCPKCAREIANCRGVKVQLRFGHK